MPSRRVWLLASVLLTWLAVGEQAARAQVQFVDQEYKLKAAYLYNFGKYVTWPQGAVPGDFVIGVLGKDPFVGGELKGLTTKTIQGKKIVIRQFDSAKDVGPCQLLFVSAVASTASDEKTPTERLAAALEKTKGSPTLVVGDTKGSAPLGAAIGFATDLAANKINLEINPDAAGRAGLSINSTLLRLPVAKIVKDQTIPR